MFDDKTLPALCVQRDRLMREIDLIEAGETLCIASSYIKKLTRLHLVDNEIQRRERAGDARNQHPAGSGREG